MRWYEVLVPGEKEAAVRTSIRDLKNLPEGTRIASVISDRDGSIVDYQEIPVVDGRPQIQKRGVRSIRMSNQV